MGGKRAPASTVWLLTVVVAAVISSAAATAAEETGCFCDCMRNQCMTLGRNANKFACAKACTEGCTQVGEPGQPNNKDFCGF